MVSARARFACLAVALASAACSRLGNEPAWNPEPLAPAASSRPWTPVAPAPPPPAPALPVPEVGRVYDLAALIDLALRANPETRISWEQARAAAARAGIADGAYWPVVQFVAQGGYARNQVLVPGGAIFTDGPYLTPTATLDWTLLDFGRREADLDRALEELRQANFQFNRRLQAVAFAVQQSFYSFDASRSEVEAQLATLQAAVKVQQAAEERLARGLATRTEVLLARQERARAEYQVQAARRAVADSHARLAEALGVSPASPLEVAPLSADPLPTGLRESVEQAIDRALLMRPDLSARLAQLRAREAEVRRARANFLPELGVNAQIGGTGGRFRAEGSPDRFDYLEPTYGAYLQFSWTLFEGFARENAVRLAEARRGRAEAELAALQLETLRSVWKTYADVKVALLQYDFAVALLAASEDAYEAALEGYRSGLADIVELLSGERDLAQARSIAIQSRAELLRSAAALAFAVGDGEASLLDARVR